MKDQNALIKYYLPETGYVRLPQLIGNLKANPPIPGIIPISKSTLYSWIKNKRFPGQVKIGPRTSAWKIEDLREFISRGNNNAE